MVSGAGKAEAVAAAIGGAKPVDAPAAGALGREATVWLLDDSTGSCDWTRATTAAVPAGRPPKTVAGGQAVAPSRIGSVRI